jgi:hypothetical protein
MPDVMLGHGPLRNWLHSSADRLPAALVQPRRLGVHIRLNPRPTNGFGLDPGLPIQIRAARPESSKRPA